MDSIKAQTLPTDLGIPLLHSFSLLPPLEKAFLASTIKLLASSAKLEAIASVTIVRLSCFALEPKLFSSSLLSASLYLVYSSSNFYSS